VAWEELDELEPVEECDLLESVAPPSGFVTEVLELQLATPATRGTASDALSTRRKRAKRSDSVMTDA